MKRAVVIGAHGQIGRPVVDALVRDGWEVTAATRSGGRSAAWPRGCGRPRWTVRMTPRSAQRGETRFHTASAHNIAELVRLAAAAERELGYRPVVSYEDSLPETVEWLTAELGAGTWDERFPLLAGAYPELFNYAAEDALLAARKA
ncbi:hypothetical protein ABZW47_27955 [Streptomyces sp. NPDC004549]|uniref:hypothetical protein n=1 Tax=Streptomyces sp. NPDC004549 TaxID=3154283 RepID=UPI0033B1425C